MDGKKAAVVTERPIEDRVAVQVGDDDNVDEDIRGGAGEKQTKCEYLFHQELSDQAYTVKEVFTGTFQFTTQSRYKQY